MPSTCIVKPGSSLVCTEDIVFQRKVALEIRSNAGAITEAKFKMDDIENYNR